MPDTQFKSLALLLSHKLNAIIDKVNTNTNSKISKSGGEFTGPIVFSSISSNIYPSSSSVYTIGSDTSMYNNVHTNNLNVGNILSINTESDRVSFNFKSSDGTDTDSIQIIDGGLVRINNSYNLPITGGEVGQTLFLDEDGDLYFDFPNDDTESSDYAKYILEQSFIGDGETIEFTVSATNLNQVMFVEINGLIQKEGTDFTVDNKTITFSEPPQIGTEGTIKFWGNDINSVFSKTDIVTDGEETSFTTDTPLTTIVYVEINGLVQKEGVDYSVNVDTNTVLFSEPFGEPSTGTILYIS